DYELMLRFLYFRRVSSLHIPEVMVNMRWDGNSRPGPANTAKMITENRRSWIKNGGKPSLFSLLWKRISKIGQFFPR
ncbi:MAG: glycosyltransferase, partial [Acidobacteria bacterium]|nr:glycosyltransferase [Acidobacteriota bacterium]